MTDSPTPAPETAAKDDKGNTIIPEVWVTHWDHAEDSPYLGSVELKPWDAHYLMMAPPITKYASQVRYIRADIYDALRAEVATLTASEEGARMMLATVIGERDAARAERDRLQHSLDLEMVRPGRFPSCDCDDEDCVACAHYPELVYQAQKRIAARAALQGEQQ